MQSENLPKPLALGDILSKAWTIFSENFRLIALIILMVYVPLNGGMEYYLYTHASKESQNSLWLIQAAVALVGLISTIAVVRITKNYADNTPLGEPVEEIQKAATTWPIVLKTAIVSGVYIMLLSMLLLIPGIIYSIYWTFSMSITILTGKSGKEAMDHSKSLVQGRWWKTVGFLFVIGMLQALFAFLPAVLGGFISWLVDVNGGILGRAIQFAFTTLGSVGMGYCVVVIAVMYLGYEATKAEGNLLSETTAV